MKFVLGILFIFASIHLCAQDLDTSKAYPLQGVSITSYREESIRETSLNITSLQVDSLARYGSYNLTDMMAKTPGVSMLTTGIAIAKPVIRGLYGNRVLVLLSGLKFDNQQWQEEHGLGIQDFGLARVELIKGPMSVLYGTEAIGGIINIVEEEKPKVNTRVSDYGIKFNSNTLGGLVQAGYKVNRGKTWFRLRIGAENNGDYSDGNSTRVVNSRFDGYYLKSSFGFQKKKWVSTNNYALSYNRFGFIFNDVDSAIKTDERWSRSLNSNPCHLVLLNVLSSENKIYLNSTTKLILNLGFQSNQRRENEGGGFISLFMHLFTVQYLAKLEKQLSVNNTLIVSTLGSFENNTNYGGRKIVPDAIMQEANLSVYFESKHRNWVFENGAGIGQKFVKTFLTPSVNFPDPLKDFGVKPFNKLAPYYNLFSGFSFNRGSRLNIKMNVATGVRIPNLAELSSNGLHEGVFTYEIGSPLLRNEQNIAFNLFSVYKTSFLEFSFSPFYNYFINYIYLAPSSESWFGFPIYRYRQQNATQYGTELSVQTKATNKLVCAISYAGMVSKTADGNYTPFVPAQKITPGITYALKRFKPGTISIFTNANYCFAQHQVAPNELATSDYWLFNLGASTFVETTKKSYSVSLTCNNVFNTAYFDHLSRFKYFGLLNAGRNIAINFRMYFNGKISGSE